jgi:hypothetical protein
MLLPLAFVFIALFVLLAIFLIFRKSTGKREMRDKNKNEV